MVRAIRAGGPDAAQAWRELLSAHQDRLFAVALRMVGDRETAADLTQDALVKVIQGIGGYDERSRLSTWMIRIVLNTCLSHLRSQKLRRHASLDAPAPWSSGDSHAAQSSQGARLEQSREPTPDESVQQEDQRRRVARAMLSLRPDQREILILRDIRGLEYDHIAEVLQIAVGTVKSRLFRARLALREILEGGPGSPTGESNPEPDAESTP